MLGGGASGDSDSEGGAESASDSEQDDQAARTKGDSDAEAPSDSEVSVVGDDYIDMLDSSDDEASRRGRGRETGICGGPAGGAKRHAPLLPEPSHAGMALKKQRVKSQTETELQGLSVAEQEALALRMLTQRDR